MQDQVDPVTLTLIIIYNAVILGMFIKWAIPEMKKFMKREYE